MLYQNSLQINAVVENIEKAHDFVYEFVLACGFGDAIAHRCALSVDEVCSNVIEHGYQQNGHDKVIDLVCVARENHIMITVIDDATPFNPLDIPSPDPRASINDRPVGGWGIEIVRKYMDKVSYRYSDNRNQLILEKYHG
ncbi:MAG: ATP-binding protein [Anaerolineae bacterium]|nr:ATP-binding protein [Anaerolineae bacterium]